MHNAEGANRLIAPCVTACPAQVDVPRYIGYAERGQFAEADAVVRESIPLPAVCGLICYRPCEPWCRRGIMESPVAINAIKRAAAEHGASDLWQRRCPQAVGAPTGKRVAIVGSGPTGLTAAYYLAKRKGHSVTIFEAMPELGGQLRIGLPEYKVPRDQLQREIEIITQTRVEVKTGVWVDSLEGLTREFDATLLAIGHTIPISQSTTKPSVLVGSGPERWTADEKGCFFTVISTNSPNTTRLTPRGSPGPTLTPGWRPSACTGVHRLT